MTKLTSSHDNMVADWTLLHPLFGWHKVDLLGTLYLVSSVCTPLLCSRDFRDDISCNLLKNPIIVGFLDYSFAIYLALF